MPNVARKQILPEGIFMTPPTLAWAIKAPDGTYETFEGIVISSNTKINAIRFFVWASSYSMAWKKLYRRGYRCVRVEIREVE